MAHTRHLSSSRHRLLLRSARWRCRPRSISGTTLKKARTWTQRRYGRIAGRKPHCSVDSGIMSSPTCHEIVCDSPCLTLENPTSDVFVTSPPASVKTSAASQLKSLGENKLRGPLFRFFPRPPRSSSSFSHGPMFGRSRTPSPPLKQPWTLTPSRPRTSTGMNTQDGCRRGLMSKRHWFSPGKFFAATA